MFKSSFKFVKCPFNSTHVIIDNRLQRHILKCMKKYPHYVRCPYNAMHFFPDQEELTKHIFQCPNKVYAEPWKYIGLPEKHGDVSEIPIHLDVPKNLNEEDWNSEYQ